MKSFNQIVARHSPDKKPVKKYKKPPQPFSLKTPEKLCRVVPLVVAQRPTFLDLPDLPYTEEPEILLNKIYKELNELKKELLNI